MSRILVYFHTRYVVCRFGSKTITKQNKNMLEFVKFRSNTVVTVQSSLKLGTNKLV